MTETVTPILILRQAAELQGLDITDERADVLAPEVQAINEAVSEAAFDLEFDDEPVGFFRALRLQKPADGGNQ
jgi:hypothetical protein